MGSINRVWGFGSRWVVDLNSVVQGSINSGWGFGSGWVVECRRVVQGSINSVRGFGGRWVVECRYSNCVVSLRVTVTMSPPC